MQNVSRAYKESIRGKIRNRGYIRATIGIYNSDAQKTVRAASENNSLLYISNLVSPFSGSVPDKVYATAEEDFARVDGSMYFAPPQVSGYEYYNNGLVSEDIMGGIYIDFDGNEFDLKGLTIDFSDCYPVDFVVETNYITRTYSGNTSRVFTTEDTFENTQFFRITPLSMVNGQNRFRIFQFSCGLTNTFTNDGVMNYYSEEYVSPIAEELPTVDAELTVANYDMYYSPDNPESAIAFVEEGQEMKVAFGYDVDGNGNIEWLPERKTYLKTWKADETQAVFTATDLFGYMSGTYYRGIYREEGISLYDLAVDVFADAEITDYYIDDYLKDIMIQNPMPAVAHTEALQIIANAGRCILKEERSGRISIQSSFIPAMEALANNEAAWSHVENVLQDDVKDGYANASNGYSILDGSVLFYPVGENADDLNTGYVSESIWVEYTEPEVKNRLAYRLGDTLKAFAIGGYWDGDMPVITINLEANYTAFGIAITFRNTAPKEFCITTYRGDELVDYVIYTNPDIDFYSDDEFLNFDRMEISFTRGYPNSRIFVDNILLGDNTNYELSRDNELISAPVATRQSRVKDISVNYSEYKESTESVSLISEEITVPYDGYEHTAYFQNASYDFLVFADSGDENVVYAEILDSSNYFAKIRFTGITEETVVRYSISGYEYGVEQRAYTEVYNQSGEAKTWNNPLVSTKEHAALLEEWLSTYFLGDVEYEIDWKGDPAVDANDLFHLETKVGKSYIRGYQNKLTFNGRWTGAMKARKVAR